MRIGSRDFDTDKGCYIMGILNVTPDSFSDGGRYNDTGRALKRAETMIAEGADIIDIGGESTRPGFTRITDEEEIERTAPVIEAVTKNFDIPVSIDTYKHRVAREAVSAGASMINDVCGLKYDNGEMAQFIAESGLPCCIMHNRSNSDYNVFMDDMLNDLREALDIAYRAGIGCESIILDPGIGFAKSYENNLEAIERLDVLVKELGYPVLLGTSRKSVIGNALGLPSSERVEGTVATTVIGVMKGACFFRVHDVKENLRAVKMTKAVMEGWQNG